MSRLRNGGRGHVSFFSFQDIITSVTGILILVTLIMTFSLRTGDAEQSPEVQLQKETQRLREIEQQNEQLQQRRIEAAKLPDATVIESQVEALRREQQQAEEQRKKSESTTESLKSRLGQSKTVAQLKEESAMLAEKLRGLQDKLAAERTNQSVVLVLPEAERLRTQKQPMVVVVGDVRAGAQRLNGAEKHDIAIDSASSLGPLLTRLNPQRDLVVFYFRPSGAKWLGPSRDAARRAGFEVG
jgi:hypothetical protein